MNDLFSNGFSFIIERLNIIPHTDLGDITFYKSVKDYGVNGIYVSF